MSDDVHQLNNYERYEMKNLEINAACTYTDFENSPDVFGAGFASVTIDGSEIKLSWTASSKEAWKSLNIDKHSRSMTDILYYSSVNFNNCDNFDELYVLITEEQVDEVKSVILDALKEELMEETCFRKIYEQEETTER
ncbi:hypothetical protein [uncultured Photobacterium sp.]|uniref:hypothetical protein n=1 Tax=uncultured Photobacterium sp. TaxID=173973 RepID=UPI00262420DE|nr:hypothetical protein [uncultured Photobacterium sp.]